MSALAPTLQAFFTERLAQRRASPNTVAAYRDGLRLLVGYVSEVSGKAPSRLDFARTSTPRALAPSSTISNTSGTSASPPAMHGSPPSTRCSASPHSATPSTPPPSPRCSPSRPSGPTGPRSAF